MENNMETTIKVYYIFLANQRPDQANENKNKKRSEESRAALEGPFMV